MFERIVSIDWSGAGSEQERVNLRIAVWEAKNGKSRIEPPPNTTARSWRRSDCRRWLADHLKEQPRSLVAMDFGFSLPWGSDNALFDVSGWRNMVRKIAAAYSQAGTARAAAQDINADARFEGHGPYRFDESRNDCRFYLEHQVAYFRQTELLAPQSISQWYLGSGGTVGFHTITGLAAIDHLLDLRDSGQIDFTVWPFEEMKPNRHVLVESYPAICPDADDYEPCHGDDEKDAWKVLQHLVQANQSSDIVNWFTLPSVRFGRIENVDLDKQLRFEGHIFGLR